jgi:hypothetical protein
MFSTSGKTQRSRRVQKTNAQGASPNGRGLDDAFFGSHVMQTPQMELVVPWWWALRSQRLIFLDAAIGMLEPRRL